MSSVKKQHSYVTLADENQTLWLQHIPSVVAALYENFFYLLMEMDPVSREKIDTSAIAELTPESIAESKGYLGSFYLYTPSQYVSEAELANSKDFFTLFLCSPTQIPSEETYNEWTTYLKLLTTLHPGVFANVEAMYHTAPGLISINGITFDYMCDDGIARKVCLYVCAEDSFGRMAYATYTSPVIARGLSSFEIEEFLQSHADGNPVKNFRCQVDSKFYTLYALNNVAVIDPSSYNLTWDSLLSRVDTSRILYSCHEVAQYLVSICDMTDNPASNWRPLGERYMMAVHGATMSTLQDMDFYNYEDFMYNCIDILGTHSESTSVF
jgi:hypothetical protein